MRGTVLKIKSLSFDCNSAEDDSIMELQENELNCNMQRVDSNQMEEESSSEDVNKNMLMSSLKLQSVKPTEKPATNQVSASNLQPTFNWNDESMWKAMSRHPLFSKYMEMSSQLNSLFEQIRLDCKKAICEKAFASLFKEEKKSPSKRKVVLVPSKFSSESPPKKLAKPCKKRGRPRKAVTSKKAGDWDLPRYPTTPTIRTIRKSREELFQFRKPSWICNKCERQFSSPRWLERHEAYCSSPVKLSNSKHISDLLKQEVSETASITPLDESTISCLEINHRVDNDTELGDAQASSLIQSTLSAVIKKIESPSLTPHQTCNSSVSPLQPKMENYYLTEEDETTKKMFDIASVCVPNGDSKCCKQQSASISHLKKHWEDNSSCKTPESINSPKSDSEIFPRKVTSLACKYCGKILRHKSSLKRHQSLCRPSSKKKSWQCIYCLKGFSSQSHCEEHETKCVQKKNVIPKYLRCENCSMRFRSQRKLLKHQVICCPDSNNEMIKLCQCPKCKLMFQNRKKQLKHRAHCCPDEETKSKVCQHCFKVFVMSDRMEAHKKKCPT